MQVAISLPIELVCQIVACLSEEYLISRDDDDPFFLRPISIPDLVVCSLVCRAWNRVCRPHIFGTILVEGDQESFYSRLSFLHFTSPHLCRYTLQLVLSLSVQPSHMQAPEWIPDCLKRFTNLRALRLDDRNRVADSWPLRRLMEPLLSTVCLKQLHLHTCVAPLNASDLLPILSACSNTLEYLSMEFNKTFEETSPAQAASEQPIVHLDALRELRLHGLPQIIRIECPNLESLTVLHDKNACNVPSWIPTGLSRLVMLGVSYFCQGPSHQLIPCSPRTGCCDSGHGNLHMPVRSNNPYNPIRLFLPPL